jgi:hypothetical protein
MLYLFSKTRSFCTNSHTNFRYLAINTSNEFKLSEALITPLVLLLEATYRLCGMFIQQFTNVSQQTPILNTGWTDIHVMNKETQFTSH